ncbi:MAG: protein translocase subunit SecD [Patescibacteria group bacterium]|nr:protein translocase subunit SecD [Patescibacteria group bacterium]MDD5121230.1 protein translocase subunit SecD [Patescibacteria group bacterium]MDD5222251.1 protein translocase subunit SecD [Patescibacteria group bacterium]MDD5395851.1 protein translocase subunit SecD [Patescibacteria group bacterium]
MHKNKLWTNFVLILILTIFALLIDIPRLPSWFPLHGWFTDQKVHLGLDLQGGTQLTYQTNTSDLPADQRAAAVEGARDVIERRVNVFGVSEPLVQTAKSGDEWRIIIELPGIKNVNEAIKMIGETPTLEFKEEAPAKVLTDQEKKEIAQYNINAQKKASDVLAKALKPGADFAALANQYSDDPGTQGQGGDLGWFSRGVMVKEFEDAAFTLKKGQIAKTLTKTEFGYHIIKKTDERTTDDAKEEIRASHILIKTESEAAIAAGGGWAYTGLTGKQLKSATMTFNPQTSEPEISLEFNAEGAKLFADITARNVDKPVAIFLDGYAISIPTVKEAITSGKAVISGKFGVQEAKDLAQRLSAGALPVPIKLISQESIGPSLGQIAVQKSIVAGVIGFLAVVIFMVVFYGLNGLIASLALLIYALINLALYKLIPVTLTLAGIAGFILSIGMAVDANVLIFERIKDERRLGKTGTTVIDDGFRHAWTAIRDSNITTLIACFILYEFGTGLVRGFGLTLGIGVLLSMFSAITVTRVILKLFVYKK